MEERLFYKSIYFLLVSLKTEQDHPNPNLKAIEIATEQINGAVPFSCRSSTTTGAETKLEGIPVVIVPTKKVLKTHFLLLSSKQPFGFE